MISLLMDTSNQYLMVALYKDGQCLKSIQELGSKRQSENAIPYLEKILQEYQLKLLDIDEMVITMGPGSYTGVRVALTIAKTLSVISSIRIKTMSSLQAYAGFERCVSVIDARSQKVFICAYQDGKPLCQEQLLPISDFSEFMKQYSGYQVIGQSEIVNYPHQEVDLAQNMYKLSLYIEPVENVELLVPRYLKDVEAKKICI